MWFDIFVHDNSFVLFIFYFFIGLYCGIHVEQFFHDKFK